MHLNIRLATPDDTLVVDHLRRAAYSAASWFQVENPANLSVRNDPPGTRVLVAADAQDLSRVLGTVALLRTEAEAALQAVLGAQVPPWARNRPVLTVMRLAVAREAQGGALNHALRRVFIEAAQHSDARGFCSSQAIGTPNVSAMQQLGYVYEEVPAAQQKTVRIANATMLVNWLPRERYAHTLAQVDALLAKREVTVRWEGAPLVF